MKISQIQQIQAVQKYRHNQERAAEQTSKQEPRKDQVSISDEAKELLQSTDAKQETRSEKIARLKQEVSAGTYQVDAHKLAEKLLPHVRKEK